MNRDERLAFNLSAALAIVSGATAAASFVLWGTFHRDVPAGVGNLRGTALTVFAIAVPLLAASMVLAAQGSVRAWFVWLGCLGYLAYNAVMFCFAAHFNAFFLPFTAMLALSFWALVASIRAIDAAALHAASARVPARTVAGYLTASLVAFAALWLSAVVPATLDNSMPQAIVDAGLTTNPVWVLDFAFTFPLMAAGSLWLWQRRPWGTVLGGLLVVMLTIETASIGIDQVFGHLHDPSASLGAVGPMVVFTALGVLFSVLFLRGVDRAPNPDSLVHRSHG